jgi:hypothetical protein
MKSQLYAGETLLGTLEIIDPEPCGFWRYYTFEPEPAFEQYRSLFRGQSAGEVQETVAKGAMDQFVSEFNERWAIAEGLNLRLVTGVYERLLTMILITDNVAAIRGHFHRDANQQIGL